MIEQTVRFSKKVNLFCLILITYGLLVCSSSFAFEGDWVAFGDLRGYIEPCGCDPATDKGGILRLGNYLDEILGRNKDTLVFSLGNNFGLSDSLKDTYIALGIDRLRPTASLVAVKETEAKSLLAGSNYVLSNAKNPFENVSEVRRSGNALVFGYLWSDDLSDQLEKFSQKLLYSWGTMSKDSAQRILLFSGPNDDLLKIASTNFFSLIISGNSASADSAIDDAESKKPGRLLRLSDPMEVYQVPLGGQGVLLGGRFRKDDVPTLDSLDSRNPLTSKIPGVALSFEEGKIVHWLEPGPTLDRSFKSLMDEYQRKAMQEFQNQSEIRKSQFKNSDFSGVSTCKSCHLGAWEIWNRSKHASSYGTLEKKAKSQNADCVVCHVLGLKDRGGFVSKEVSPDFASVQCENCHGPGKEHVGNPKIKPNLNSRSACLKCHHSPHTAHFNYGEYWEKIKH